MRPLVLALLALTASTIARAQGSIIPRPCVFGVFPADNRTPPIVRDPAPIRDCGPHIARTHSAVRVEMIDRVLHYEIDERFLNRGSTVGEADYIFPLPANAAFEDLKLSINGQLVSGETMNANDARRIYEGIVRAQRDPALVEWMGHGLIHARIFPINPGEEKRVVVRFQSVAQREGDALRVDYFRGGSDGDASFTLAYRPAPDLGNPYSPTHQLDVTEAAGMRRVDVRGNARDVTLLVPVRKPSAASTNMLPYAPGNEDGFALVTVTPPASQRDEATPRDVTLVLDVSGSMSGRKIEQARAAGKQLLATLRPADRFRLIDFSSDVRDFRDDFAFATAGNIRDAERYLESLQASGGTNIEGALRETMRAPLSAGRLPLVLFITDGEPTVGEQSPERLAQIASAADREPRRRIFTFGLGSDVNVSLLEQLALEGRGTAQFVRPEESVERMVGVVAERLTDPVLTDVRITADGDVKLARMLPSQPSDVFADRDLVLLARYSGHGRARINVDGVRRGSPVHWTTTVDFPDRDRSNPFVARLWATQRVGFLSAEKRKNGGSREIDEEIRMLGERYGVLTEFNSYLVTEPRSGVAMDQARLMRSGVPAVAAAAPAPMALQEMRFEAAKSSAAQRATTNLAAADSAFTVSSNSATVHRVGGHTMTLKNGVWTDAAYRDGMQRLAIKPYSNAYFDALDAVPELRELLALGTHVIAAGKRIAIVLADDGASDLAVAAKATLIKEW